ncbi:MAG: hypothetical protein LAT75_11975 [Candidatus Cyclonatronum sp.]|uniref:hypothetical protein n=1 Tax=Cyclonatronum sp. TaxID=3024185 RepID=UPI0025C2D74B|nr:hypothetical protein [Cyclonatronum sp.]MCH8487577.1 hypothetical protein [Cyclonatronum sp.]
MCRAKSEISNSTTLQKDIHNSRARQGSWQSLNSQPKYKKTKNVISNSGTWP